MKAAERIISAVSACILSLSLFCLGELQAEAYSTIDAEIPVTCLKVEDNNSHIYQIKIESENDISPAPISDTLYITENGTGYFEINIDEPGTFRYRIYEETGSDPNIEYDDNIYAVSVFVENGIDDELIYSVTANIVGRDGKLDNIEFINAVLAETDIVTTTTPSSTTAPPKTTTTVTTTDTPVTTTVTTTAKPDHTENPLTGFIDSVLTGDSFPAHAIRTIMLLSVIVAATSFLFKRKDSEEENSNEE
ncbi:MAG: hypothetical protein K5979_14195 [Ruminococcus sp.]|nr:hypothetical protein [Ruminococcus sp.]